MTKPLLDKLGGGRGDGRWGEHGQSEERVVRKSRLGPNSLSQQMRQTGHRTLLSHSHPTWPQISLPPSKTHAPAQISFLSTRAHSTTYKEGIVAGNLTEEPLRRRHRTRQAKAVPGVPHHVITTASQRLFVPRVAWYLTGQIKRERSHWRISGAVP